MIALLELAAGASIYTYRTTLIEGFDRGLNESLNAYGVDRSKTFHFDLMQKTVNFYFSSQFCPGMFRSINFLSRLSLSQLHCCGNKAYTDYLNLSPPKIVPSSCCSVQEGECDTTDIEDIFTEVSFHSPICTIEHFYFTCLSIFFFFSFNIQAFQ